MIKGAVLLCILWFWLCRVLPVGVFVRFLGAHAIYPVVCTLDLVH